jgi:hypothetical protein
MRTEREFLHDVSSPISTMLFMIDSIMDDATEAQNEKLAKLQNKINELRKLIEERRNEIKSNQP